MNLLPSVQIAQDRLREFKRKNSASIKEIQAAIGVKAEHIERLLKQKAGPNIYANLIAEKLSDEAYDDALYALARFRGEGEKSEPNEDTADVEPSSAGKLPAEKGDDLVVASGDARQVALRKIKALKEREGLSVAKLVPLLNAAGGRQFKPLTLVAAVTPTGIKKMGTGYAMDIIRAVDYCLAQPSQMFSREKEVPRERPKKAQQKSADKPVKHSVAAPSPSPAEPGVEKPTLAAEDVFPSPRRLNSAHQALMREQLAIFNTTFKSALLLAQIAVLVATGGMLAVIVWLMT